MTISRSTERELTEAGVEMSFLSKVALSTGKLVTVEIPINSRD